jgi:hypothetical protein
MCAKMPLFAHKNWIMCKKAVFLHMIAFSCIENRFFVHYQRGLRVIERQKRIEQNQFCVAVLATSTS